MSISSAVSFAVLCQKYGQRDARLDLRAGDNAVLIQKLAKQCANFDARITKRASFLWQVSRDRPFQSDFPR